MNRRPSSLRGVLSFVALAVAVSACSAGGQSLTPAANARAAQSGGTQVSGGGGGGTGGGTTAAGASGLPMPFAAVPSCSGTLDAMSSAWSTNHSSGINTIATTLTVTPQCLVKYKVEYINDLTGESEHTEWAFDFNFTKYTVTLSYAGAHANTPYNTRVTVYNNDQSITLLNFSQTISPKGIVTPTAVPASPAGCSTTIDSFVPSQARLGTQQSANYAMRILTCQPVTWRIDSKWWFVNPSDPTAPPTLLQMDSVTGSSDRSITDSGIASAHVANGNWEFTLTVMDASGNVLASNMTPLTEVLQP